MQGRAEPEGRAAGTRARHVFLIEDEPHIAEAIRFLLTREGWRVSTHPGGPDALGAVRAAAPDLLILDVMLPGMSGFDILAALRADPAGPAIPVMMLTAKGQGRDREAAERAGADRFMSKPFSNAEFLASVRELTGGAAA